MRNCVGNIARAALLGVSFAALAASTQAAEYKMTVNKDRLINAQNEPQNWLMMNGDYGSTRYSKLTQINRDNVKNLRLVWALALLMLLAHLGVNITALVTSLGIGGVAFALAIQNVLGDILASLAIAMGTLYLYYFIENQLHYVRLNPGQTVDDGLTIVIVIYAVCVVLTAIIGGIISDRIGKRKMIVTVSGTVIALILITLMLRSCPPVLLPSLRGCCAPLNRTS